MEQTSEQLKELIAKEPDNAELYYRLGLQLQREFPNYSLKEDHGTYQTYEYKGVDELEKATKLDPMNYEYTFTYAMFREKRGDTNIALRLLKRCAELDPQAEGLNDEIVRVQNVINAENERQKEHARESLSKKPDDVNSMHFMAMALSAEEKYEEALEWYNKALAVPDVDRETTYVLLAGLHNRFKHYEKAIAAYQKAIEHYQPYEPDADDLADPDYEPDNNANLYVHIAECYSELKNYDKAEEYYKQALQIDPDYSDILVYLAHLECDRADYTKALNLYLEAVDRVDPARWPTLDEAVGLCYFELNDFENAKLWMEKCIKKNRGYSRAYYNLAVIFDRLNDEEGVEMTLQMAVQANKTDVRALYQLAKIYVKQGYYKDALEMLEKALFVNPFEDNVIALKAEIYANMGDSEKAEWEAGYAKFIRDMKEGKEPELDEGEDDDEEDGVDEDDEDQIL